MLLATEISYSPKAVTEAVIIIKGKERKKKTTSNCQSFRKRFLKFLEVSGRQWEAQLLQGAPQRKFSSPPSIVPRSCGSEWY